ncbi:hypothetical protein M2139_001307 [Enterococcus sp. PF1-24]|uniref:DUF3788 family protein n=1 Tax=unclassified Enterococcus TaxID=2608891 RepID=UPI0024756945|nr:MULTISPECIES: DUF3788 family protein [unclassified Enterococcus]MDH6364388.1 hypothetical protein [Enterococcus sp. PFB1-1]MDH6401423.1 hypothetical protein [Enterococcus sp. PF1-24]
MEKPILNDATVFPSAENLQQQLSPANYLLYQQLIAAIQQLDFCEEWHYYKDGKAWLAKILAKKKNLGWISIWGTGVKVSIYFGWKIWPKLMESPLFARVEAYPEITIQENSKLVALILPIQEAEHIELISELLSFKKTAK